MADDATIPRAPAWNTAALETVRCDVANAAVERDRVQVHAGVRVVREDGTTGVEHARTLVLTPYAARRLQELLAVLLGEHDRRHGGPG